jgi:hypothetical protein
MKQTIYNFQPIKAQLEHETKGEIYKVRDYFEFYHTGIEELPFTNEKLYFATNRLPNERSEVLTNEFYEDPDLSDIILALNNDVYLWDAPFDTATQEMIAQNQIAAIEENRKQKLSKDQINFYYLPKINENLEVQNSKQSVIVLPRFKNLARVTRLMKKYLNQRRVY